MVNTIPVQNSRDRFIGRWLSKHQCTTVGGYEIPMEIVASNNSIDFSSYISDGPEPYRCVGKFARR